MATMSRDALWSSLALAGVLLAASALRLAFFTGFFGSDEVTYTSLAYLISEGIWKPSTYIGSVRLGVNLPVGFLLWLFGHHEFVANLWSLATSLGEIVLVFLLARRFWGTQAALLSAVLLASTPLHAHYAGRLMADSPLAFFITLSFFAFFRGQESGSWRWHLVAGLAAGFVWWIKSSVAPIYVLVFAVYLIRERRLERKWFVMGAGFVAMLALNSAIFWVMQDDFWHLLRLTTTGNAVNVQQAGMATDPTYYLRYLFIDLRHTWLLGPLALLGLIVWRIKDRDAAHVADVAIWGVGLALAFSLFVVSFRPLILIPKQVNYMLIFLAPLALLGGYGLSRLPAVPRYAVLIFVITTGVIGTALEQQVIRTFVSNSKAALAYAGNLPNRPVYGMTNAHRYSKYAALFSPDPRTAMLIRDLKELDDDLARQAHTPDGAGFVAYAIVDLETAGWGKHDPFHSLATLPSCWRQIDTLSPSGQGAGAWLVSRMASTLSALPGTRQLTEKLLDVIQPQPAFVYGIPPHCNSPTTQS
jgi:hypothetical protein